MGKNTQEEALIAGDSINEYSKSTLFITLSWAKGHWNFLKVSLANKDSLLCYNFNMTFLTAGWTGSII